MPDWAPLFIVLAAVLFFALVGLLMWLWNITMPDVFGTKKLKYWQAFRLMLICSILFGPGLMF